MLEYSHPIFIKGSYRVVALTENPEYNEDNIIASEAPLLETVCQEIEQIVNQSQ